jgi:hypothetical protein
MGSNSKKKNILSIAEMKAEIDAILELRDTALIDAVEEKEMDFLDNYNRHMTHIYMQM